ncbi:MAG: hydrogenase 3 maturation endopeptidase HyCI [Anaerolineae bacterium]|nr:hydrogenase 3 maturation endopeptidase HyCI [Anaerolineae bacterium]
MLSERSHRPRRVAILGIGNESRGDDAAGILVARALQPIAHDRLLVVEAGLAPENQTGRLRQFEPELVLLVDAAKLGAAAGTVRWLSWEETGGITASTHTTPPSMLGRFLVESLGCDVVLIGIQPADTAFEAALSPGVAASVDAVTQSLTALFGARTVAHEQINGEILYDGSN